MKLFFHIGFHKTGTTFLQNNIFPNISGASFVPRFAALDLLNGLMNHEQYKKQQTINLLMPYVKDETVVISFEGLVGNPFYSAADTVKRIAERICLFDNVHVIVTIRNQISLIDSLYRQFVQQGGSEHFREFIDESNGIFDFNYCDYYRVISEYTSRIGKERVSIFTQEKLKDEADNSTARLLNVFGKSMNDLNNVGQGPGNISMTNLSINLMRLFNRFSTSSINGVSKKGIVKSTTVRMLMQYRLDPWIFSKISKKKSYLSEEMKDMVKSYYFKSNMNLDSDFNLSLKELGYY